MTLRDSIVEELRKQRAQIAREHGNDVEAIVEALEGEVPSETLISLPPKRLRSRGTRRRPQAGRRAGRTAVSTARSSR
jgi:hypothetical protein